MFFLTKIERIIFERSIRRGRKNEKLVFSKLIVCKKGRRYGGKRRCLPSSSFLRFIPFVPAPGLFPVESDSVPITVKRLNVSRLLVLYGTFVFSKLGSIIVNEQTIVAGSVLVPIRYFRKFLRN